MKLSNAVKLVAVGILFSINAHAASGPITCVASNDESLTLNLERDPDQYTHSLVAGSVIELHAMNVAIKSLPVRVDVAPILTRTIVGFEFNFELLSGATVKLKDVNYAPTGFESQIGISGVAQLPSGEVLKLQCDQAQFAKAAAVTNIQHPCRVPCAHPFCIGYSEERCGL